MSSQTKAHLTATSLLLVVLCLFPAETLDFPVAFTVVRNLDPPLGIDVFLNQTGCCQKDGFGNPSGYNVVSLDGFKSASTPATVQNGVSPLSFWANAFSQIAALKTGKGGSTTASLQQYLLDTYHDNGMTLLMNVFADEAPIS